jgi:hypothetical protein
MNDDLLSLLLRKSRYTWLVFGAMFIICGYNTAGRDTVVNGAIVKVLNIGPPIMLMVLYYLLGQASAFLITKMLNPIFDPFMALFCATIKGGLIVSILNVAIHGGLLWLSQNYTWESLPDFRSPVLVIIGAFIFPFMACLSASATLQKG